MHYKIRVSHVPPASRRGIIYIYIYLFIYFYLYLHFPPTPRNLAFARYLQHLGGTASQSYCRLYTAFGRQPPICMLFAAFESHNLATGSCLAVYFYPKPVYVLPVAYLTPDLPLIVCRLYIFIYLYIYIYTQSVPMHTKIYTYYPISLTLACSMYPQIRVHIQIHIYIYILNTHISLYIYMFTKTYLYIYIGSEMHT